MKRFAHFLRRELSFGVALFALLMGAQPGKATLVLCSTGSGIDLVNDGCYAPGNDDLTSVSTAITQATGTAPLNLALYGKSDTNPSLFSFAPNPPGGAFSGTWSVLSGTLISYLTVKAGPQFAVYELSPPSSSGTWTTAGLVVGSGNQPGLSHLSFWTAGGEEPQEPPIPEPSTYALVGSGLVVLAWRLRRRRR